VAITKLKLIATSAHASKRLNEAVADWLTGELGALSRKRNRESSLLQGLST
jgi:hypothetical protein